MRARLWRAVPARREHPLLCWPILRRRHDVGTRFVISVSPRDGEYTSVMGTLRFVLAGLVATSHLAGKSGGLHQFMHLGHTAVFGFYLVAGFLITRVLQETYSFRLAPFAMNRFLRLFPMYAVVAVVTLCVIVLWPEAAGAYHSAWQFGDWSSDLFGNLLIVPFLWDKSGLRLIPPTWSIAVEIANYALLWLVVSRNHRMAGFAVLVGIGYHAMSYSTGEPFSARYAPVGAALLPFGLGAAAYFMSRSLPRDWSPSPRLPGTLLSVWLAVVIVPTFDFRAFELVFYASLALLLAFIVATANTEASPLDRRLGDLSYPMFLLHWLVGFPASAFLLSAGSHGLTLLLLAALPLLASSWLLADLGNRIVEPLRDRIRGSARPSVGRDARTGESVLEALPAEA